MNAFLTTELTSSPAVHLGSHSLAGRCIFCNSLTQHILSALIQAYIINTVFKVVFWVHLGMAVTEWPFGVSQQTTEIPFFIFDLLGNVTIRTHPFTAINTAWDLGHSPAGTKTCWRDRFVTIFRSQVILGFAIIVATEATNGFHVVAWQGYKHSAFPVEGDFEAKSCSDHSIQTTLKNRYLSSCQGDR